MQQEQKEQQQQLIGEVINTITHNWERNQQLGVGDSVGFIKNDATYYSALKRLDHTQYIQLAETVAELFESGRWQHPRFSATDCMSVCLEVEQQMKSPTDGADWDTERNKKRGCATKTTLFKFFRMIAETEVKTSAVFTNIIHKEPQNVTIN